jgi:hypothetical protein
VKRVIADGSVGLPHVRVGHRQALNTRNPGLVEAGVFALGRTNAGQKKGPGAFPAAGPFSDFPVSRRYLAFIVTIAGHRPLFYLCMPSGRLLFLSA